MGQDERTPNFAAQERDRIEEELAELRSRRDQMRAELQGDADTVGDRGDAADALQRSEDLAGIDEQINRLTWLLAGERGRPRATAQRHRGDRAFPG